MQQAQYSLRKRHDVEGKQKVVLAVIGLLAITTWTVVANKIRPELIKKAQKALVQDPPKKEKVIA